MNKMIYGSVFAALCVAAPAVFAGPPPDRDRGRDRGPYRNDGLALAAGIVNLVGDVLTPRTVVVQQPAVVVEQPAVVVRQPVYYAPPRRTVVVEQPVYYTAPRRTVVVEQPRYSRPAPPPPRPVYVREGAGPGYRPAPPRPQPGRGPVQPYREAPRR